MVRYSHPEMFYLFIPYIIFIVWYYLQGKKLHNGLNKLGVEKIRSFLLNRFNSSMVLIRSRLFVLSIFFILFASTGPQIGTTLTELNRKGVDIFILLDISKSMDAQDVKPSRLDKAKYELGRLINKLNGDRIGLIAFAGSAHLHCPLTIDYNTAKLFLNIMDTNLIQNQGTNLSEALELAIQHIKDDDEKYKLILVVSDGEDHVGEAFNFAEQAKNLGIIIHTIGVGTPSGAPIPIYDKEGNRVEFKKNKQNQIVTSTLNEYSLNEIADVADGIYLRIANQSNAINPILTEISKMEKKDIKSHIFSQYEDRYQVFLFISLILLIVEFLVPTKNRQKVNWQGKFVSK